MKYYLAYGSNLSVEQMLRRCPDAVYVGTGEIKNYRLLFKGSQTGSYMTIEPKKGRKVPVLVWKVSDEDEEALDLYEGYPRFYQKEEIDIEVKSLIDDKPIGTVQAFVYMMDPSRPLGKPSELYFDVCLEGYERFSFNPSILDRAYSESCGSRRQPRKIDWSRMELIGGSKR